MPMRAVPDAAIIAAADAIPTVPAAAVPAAAMPGGMTAATVPAAMAAAAMAAATVAAAMTTTAAVAASEGRRFSRRHQHARDADCRKAIGAEQSADRHKASQRFACSCCCVPDHFDHLFS
jgi:hypothetical protein